MADDLRPTVQRLLRALPTRKVDALKQLFWSELNYDRVGAMLSMAGWSPELQAHTYYPDGKERGDLGALVQALLARKAAGGDVAALEAAIDGAVCRLFGVGEEEIGMVEGGEVS